MSESKHGHPEREPPESDRVRQGQLPYWQRAHHDWRFWVGMCFMLAAIAIYVLSDDLAFLPHG